LITVSISFLGKWKELSPDTIYEDAPLFAPSLSAGTPSFLGDMGGERFSRKVFVGGLPPDIDEGIPRSRTCNIN